MTKNLTFSSGDGFFTLDPERNRLSTYKACWHAEAARVRASLGIPLGNITSILVSFFVPETDARNSPSYQKLDRFSWSRTTFSNDFRDAEPSLAGFPRPYSPAYLDFFPFGNRSTAEEPIDALNSFPSMTSARLPSSHRSTSFANDVVSSENSLSVPSPDSSESTWNHRSKNRFLIFLHTCKVAVRIRSASAAWKVSFVTLIFNCFTSVTANWGSMDVTVANKRVRSPLFRGPTRCPSNLNRALSTYQRLVYVNLLPQQLRLGPASLFNSKG